MKIVYKICLQIPGFGGDSIEKFTKTGDVEMYPFSSFVDGFEVIKTNFLSSGNILEVDLATQRATNYSYWKKKLTDLSYERYIR